MPHVSACACAPGRGALCVLWAVLALLASVESLHAQTAQSLRIVPLVRADQVLVTFELAEGFTDEVRAAIRSGLKTTYTYTIEMRLAVPLWVDRAMGTATLTSSVEYDNLTRRFTMERRLDGRLEDARQTEDEALVREWMTKHRQMALFKTTFLEPNREYYVRVSATARPSNGSMLWPFGSGTSAQTKFTFLR
jgi:hypothetical protein